MTDETLAYPDMAGISDAAVRASTPFTWAEWVQHLDALGARQMTHAAIAAAVQTHWPAVSGWWAQSVAVGYGRIRGLRAQGQKSTGDFAVSKSKTFAVSVSVLYAAFEEGVRDSWMGEVATQRTAQAGRSMRLTWPDGTVVAAWFTDKGDDKSAVSIQHEKLESAERRAHEKERWAERLVALQRTLAG